MNPMSQIKFAAVMAVCQLFVAGAFASDQYDINCYNTTGLRVVVSGGLEVTPKTDGPSQAQGVLHAFRGDKLMISTIPFSGTFVTEPLKKFTLSMGAPDAQVQSLVIYNNLPFADLEVAETMSTAVLKGDLATEARPMACYIWKLGQH